MVEIPTGCFEFRVLGDIEYAAACSRWRLTRGRTSPALPSATKVVLLMPYHYGAELVKIQAGRLRQHSNHIL